MYECGLLTLMHHRLARPKWGEHDLHTTFASIRGRALFTVASGQKQFWLAMAGARLKIHTSAVLISISNWSYRILIRARVQIVLVKLVDQSLTKSDNTELICTTLPIQISTGEGIHASMDFRQCLALHLRFQHLSFCPLFLTNEQPSWEHALGHFI